MWGRWVHVGPLGTGKGFVYDLARPSAAPRPAPASWFVAMSQGALVWRRWSDRSPAPSLMALDLTDPTSRPVRLGGFSFFQSGESPDPATDDHLVAWEGRDAALRVAPLPFDQATRFPPRLLGVVARGAFSPDGDGRYDVWRAGFDSNKPLGRYDVTLTDSTGSVVRSFSGSSPDGGVRVRWNGKDGSGADVPDGTYRWTLTGSAADGEGTLRDLDGAKATHTGFVTVHRVATTG